MHILYTYIYTYFLYIHIYFLNAILIVNLEYFSIHVLATPEGSTHPHLTCVQVNPLHQKVTTVILVQNLDHLCVRAISSDR